MGEPSPFTGQCMTVERSIRIGQLATSCDARIEIEVGYRDRLRDIDVNECRLHRANDAEAAGAKLQLTEQALADSRSWRWHPALWFSVGVVTTVAAVLVARYAVVQP